MTNTESVLIDTLEFNPPIPMEYDKVIGMFESTHDSSCCEWHELDFDSTKLDFETAAQFINKVDKIEIKWIEWMGINIRLFDWNKEFPIFVPWRWSNNGYYGDNIELIVTLPSWETKSYNCTDYQNY